MDDLHHHHEELLLLLHSSLSLNWNYPHHYSLNNGEELIHSNEANLIDPSLMVEDLGVQQHLAKIKHQEQIALLHDLSTHYPSAGFDPWSFGMFLPAGAANAGNPFVQPPQQSDQFSRSVITPCHAPFLDYGSIDYGIQHHLNEMPPSDISGVAVNKSSSSCSSSMDQLKPSKKPRLEPRPSLSPFKVRKEKLGDRIAALQQLVSPFGKTDTASVLTEAVGYIKFLQDQVETLSVAYMGPSNNKNLRATKEVSTDEREEIKPDLRTRGLCLVPLSCTSYVTGDNVVWSLPNFR